MSYPAAKSVIIISPVSTTAAGTATGIVDTLGAAYAVIDVCATTSNNVTNNPSVLKLAEATDTVASNFTNVATFVGDSAWVIPNADTANSQIVAQFRVPLTGRKRYLRVDVSPVTTQTIWSHGRLYTGDEEVPTPTLTGAAAVVVGV